MITSKEIALLCNVQHCRVANVIEVMYKRGEMPLPEFDIAGRMSIYQITDRNQAFKIINRVSPKTGNLTFERVTSAFEQQEKEQMKPADNNQLTVCGHEVAALENGMVSLTAMWVNAGRDPVKRPREWVKTDYGQKVIAYYDEKMSKGGNIPLERKSSTYSNSWRRYARNLWMFRGGAKFFNVA